MASVTFFTFTNPVYPFAVIHAVPRKCHWGDPDVDGRIILRWIFGKWEGVETGWSWLRIGTDGGHLLIQ